MMKFRHKHLLLILCMGFLFPSLVIGHDDDAPYVIAGEYGRGQIETLAVQPQHHQLAVAGREVRLYSPALADVLTFPESRDVRILAWSRDGSQLAGAYASGGIIIWSADGQVKQRFPDTETLVIAMDWNADGTLLATGDNQGKIRIWDIKTGSEQRSFFVDFDRVNSLAWHPTENWIATGGRYKIVRVWNAVSGQLQFAFDDYEPLTDEGAILSVSWNTDGTELASAGKDGAIRIWDVATRSMRLLLDNVPEGQRRFAYSREVSWQPGGTLIASDISSSPIYEGDMRVWDVATGQLQERIVHTFPIFVDKFDWSSNGATLVIGTQTHISGWDIQQRQETFFNPGYVGRFEGTTWSPDSIRFAGFDWTSNQLLIFHVAQQDPIYKLPITTRSIDWHPESNLIAASLRDEVQLIDGTTGSITSTIPIKSGVVVWHPSGDQLALIQGDGRVLIWDMQNQEVLHSFETEQHNIHMLWSPQGNYLAILDDIERLLQIWDMINPRPKLEQEMILTGDAFVFDFQDMRWFDDEKHIATSIEYGGAAVIIWNVETGEPIITHNWKQLVPKIILAMGNELYLLEKIVTTLDPEPYRILKWEIPLPNFSPEGLMELSEKFSIQSTHLSAVSTSPNAERIVLSTIEGNILLLEREAP